MMLPADLLPEWRQRAEQLERYAPPAAEAFRSAADELAAALAEAGYSALTPAEAEAEGRCSAETVRRMVRDGRAENVGTPGAIRVPVSQLPPPKPTPPRESRRRASSFGQIARDAVADRSRERAP